MIATLITFLAQLLPPLGKVALELYFGKKLSREEFQAFIKADKESRRYVAEANRNVKAEIKRLKAERLNRIKLEVEEKKRIAIDKVTQSPS